MTSFNGGSSAVISGSVASLDSGRGSVSRETLLQHHQQPGRPAATANTFGVVRVVPGGGLNRPPSASKPTPPSAAILRQSYHSASSSSLGSLEARGDLDSICALNVREMIANGIPVSGQH